MGGITKISETKAASLNAEVSASSVPKTLLQPRSSTSSVVPNAGEEAVVASLDGDRNTCNSS